LLTLNRWLRSVLYFWTFAFATMAFIQPTLTQGPAHVVFWAFWLAHVVILACAVYDLAALGFRPGWSDFARAAAVAVGWAAVVLAIDLRLGANYGYSATRRPAPGFRRLSPRSVRGRSASSSWQRWRPSSSWRCSRRGASQNGWASSQYPAIKRDPGSSKNPCRPRSRCQPPQRRSALTAAECWRGRSAAPTWRCRRASARRPRPACRAGCRCRARRRAA